MSSDVEEHVIYRIANAPILEYPFPHQFVTSVFPADFYRSLVSSLPPEHVFRPLVETGVIVGDNDYAERTVCTFPDIAKHFENSDEGKPFADLGRWLLGRRFHDFVLRHFRLHVRNRFGANVELQTSVDGRFIRDHSNYSIGPHTDSPKKLVSMLFYLPKDDSMKALGTSVYVPATPGFRSDTGLHYQFRDFKQVTTVPYVPNSLFLFFRTDSAFHGVEPITIPAVERDLLLYNIYVNNAVPHVPPQTGWRWFRRKSATAN